MMNAFTSVDPVRSAQIIGYVKDIVKNVSETTITIRVVDEKKYDDNIMLFDVVFKKPERKTYVDTNVESGDLIVCLCELTSTLDEKGRKVLTLEGDYVVIFRGDAEELTLPEPAYVDPDTIDDAAF